MKNMEIQTEKDILFPLMLEKYTAKGNRSTAKNSTIKIKNNEELQEFLNTHIKKHIEVKNIKELQEVLDTHIKKEKWKINEKEK